MDINRLMKIFNDTNFAHPSGTDEELKVAEYLRDCCTELGVKAKLEAFDVAMAEITGSHVYADGREIPAKALYCCGSGEVTAPLYYMPSADKYSISLAKDKIVLMDSLGIGYYTYQDLVEAGARGILFQYGNMYYPFDDIDQRDLRKHVVGDSPKLLCAMLNSRTAVELVKTGVKEITISIEQNEYVGKSHNVVAEIPGKKDEWITLSAHYDSTALSNGSYDNMSGCAGLIGVMQELRNKELNYGLRFVFCGSEERGLLGSKAYVRDHEAELPKTALNINLDMIGSIMGKFISRVSAEEKLADYITYMGCELGFPTAAKVGVYSSDSTPFADAGVPAVSFARIAGPNVAPIHCRFDTPELLSAESMAKDTAFIAAFTERMACAVSCPVSREIPDKVKTELDEYLFRKRKSN